MLSRTYRIPTSQFPAVTRGKSFQNDVFRVVVKYDDTLKNPKCAVIVSNKIAKTAVSRNRIRRQVYDALGIMLKDLPNAYISVFPKKIPLEHATILSSLKNLLNI